MNDTLRIKNYKGSIKFQVKKIEVFSFSNLAVPYYHIQTENEEDLIIGGPRMGSLEAGKVKDLSSGELQDPIWVARNWEFLATSLGIMDCNYQVALLHAKIAEMDCDDCVLIDIFSTELENYEVAELGASNLFYVQDENGHISMRLAEGINLPVYGQ